MWSSDVMFDIGMAIPNMIWCWICSGGSLLFKTGSDIFAAQDECLARIDRQQAFESRVRRDATAPQPWVVSCYFIGEYLLRLQCAARVKWSNAAPC